MTSAELAAALLLAVQAQQFATTPDRLLGGAPVRQLPSVDLAVIAFPEGGPPVAANVLFSREHPQGLVAEFGHFGDFGAVRNIRYVKDQRDAASTSVAWLPEADWSQLRFEPLFGEGPQRFVAPYPASLIKLMVLVGVARAIDRGATDWSRPWTWNGRTESVHAWAEAMTTYSNNDATSALVALLHERGSIVREGDRETRNDLNADFAAYGLPTLRFDNTRADGGWLNSAGAGVGHLHMTAWDSARLLWLLDADAPPAPWLTPGTPPLLRPPTRDTVRAILADQALHEVLSSTALAGVADWRPGLPAQLPARWIAPDGAVVTPDHRLPGDARMANAKAELRFAHKTGTTENYVSDAGIVTGITPQRRHYLIAILASLGTRYAPCEHCATTWRIPALGAAIDAWLAARLEHQR